VSFSNSASPIIYQTSSLSTPPWPRLICRSLSLSSPYQGCQQCNGPEQLDISHIHRRHSTSHRRDGGFAHSQESLGKTNDGTWDGKGETGLRNHLLRTVASLFLSLNCPNDVLGATLRQIRHPTPFPGTESSIIYVFQFWSIQKHHNHSSFGDFDCRKISHLKILDATFSIPQTLEFAFHSRHK
jgi:hypothetical protein